MLTLQVPGLGDGTVPFGLHVTASTLPKSFPVIVSLTDPGRNCRPFGSSFAPEPQTDGVEGRGTSCAQVLPAGGGVGVSQSVYVVVVENATVSLYVPSDPVDVDTGCAPP